MRYPPNQKDRSRRRILSAASRMFLERGYRATGVAAIMKAAGMTAGGFYAHFPSKEALLRESLVAAFHDFRRRLAGGGGPRKSAPEGEFVRTYFEAFGLAETAGACPISSLGSDIARATDALRESFEDELQKTAKAVAARLRQPVGIDRALSLLALCSGAVLLSRAVKGPETRNRILEACLRESGYLAGLSPR